MKKKEKKHNISNNFIVTFFKSVFYGIFFIFYLIYIIISFPFRKMFRKKSTNVSKEIPVKKQKILHNSTKKKDEIRINQKEEMSLKNEIKELMKAREEDLKRQKEERLRLKREKEAEALRIKKEKEAEALRIKKEKEAEALRIKKEKEAEVLRIKKEKEELIKAKSDDIKRQKQYNLKLKEEKAKLAKEEKRRQIEANKEQEKIDKKEADLRKKHKFEDYINENIDIKKEKKKEKKQHSVSLIQKIKDKYHNSLLYKNAKHKKDKQHQVMIINFDGEDAIKSEEKQVFEYVAKNPEGKIVKDYFPAYSRVEVHSFLLSEGYEIYSIKTSKAINLLHKSVSTAKFKIKDLIFFLTQLSTYVKAGIPLVEALKILSRQFSKKKKYVPIFRTLIYNLTIGDNFSTAMEKCGRAFPNLLINMIKASEMTGELPEALDDMADYYTQSEATRKQMVTALTYPAIVFVFAVGVITFILLYVVPKFVDIYTSMDASQIPSFTLLVMNMSYFLQDYFFIIAAVVLGFVIMTIILYKKVAGVRLVIQWILMHIPVIKDVIIYNEVTMFTKTFSSLLAHNVFITDTLQILGKITNNEVYKLLVEATAANLERGEKISVAFENQWAFPVPAYEMIVTGERTGQLSEMMGKVSTYYQGLHANTVGRIKAFIEPILIVGLTVVVGFIVLAIVIPMFNLYNQVI